MTFLPDFHLPIVQPFTAAASGQGPMPPRFSDGEPQTASCDRRISASEGALPPT